jgi:hypothetical protein
MGDGVGLTTRSVTYLLCLLAFVGTAQAQDAAAENEAETQTAEMAAPTPSEVPAPPEMAATAVAAPPAMDPAAEAQFIAQLQSPDARVRVRAIRGLGESRSPNAVEPLARIVRRDPIPEVRGWALRSLQAIGSHQSLAVVAQVAQSDPDERVRAMAARIAGVHASVPLVPTAAAQAADREAALVQVPVRPRVPGRGLRTAGWITTGVSYGLALIVGLAMVTVDETGEFDSFDERAFGWQFMLPIVGPAVASTVADFGEASIPFWIWSAAEVAGVVLLAVGYAQRAKWLRQNPNRMGRQGLGVFALAPGGPRGTPGLTFRGAF